MMVMNDNRAGVAQEVVEVGKTQEAQQQRCCSRHPEKENGVGDVVSANNNTENGRCGVIPDSWSRSTKERQARTPTTTVRPTIFPVSPSAAVCRTCGHKSSDNGSVKDINTSNSSSLEAERDSLAPIAPVAVAQSKAPLLLPKAEVVENDQPSSRSHGGSTQAAAITSVLTSIPATEVSPANHEIAVNNADPSGHCRKRSDEASSCIVDGGATSTAAAAEVGWGGKPHVAVTATTGSRVGDGRQIGVVLPGNSSPKLESTGGRLAGKQHVKPLINDDRGGAGVLGDPGTVREGRSSSGVRSGSAWQFERESCRGDGDCQAGAGAGARASQEGVLEVSRSFGKSGSKTEQFCASRASPKFFGSGSCEGVDSDVGDRRRRRDVTSQLVGRRQSGDDVATGNHSGVSVDLRWQVEALLARVEYLERRQQLSPDPTAAAASMRRRHSYESKSGGLLQSASDQHRRWMPAPLVLTPPPPMSRNSTKSGDRVAMGISSTPFTGLDMLFRTPRPQDMDQQQQQHISPPTPPRGQTQWAPPPGPISPRRSRLTWSAGEGEEAITARGGRVAPRTPEEEQQRSDSPSDWRLSDVVSSGSSRDQNAAAAAGEGRSQFATEHGGGRLQPEGYEPPIGWMF